MENLSIIGIDLAKHVFQLHGASKQGEALFRRKVRRGQLLAVLGSLPPCEVVMEACGSAHYWGREISALGHRVRLVPPIYVKPFVKRSKNDAADAEAIVEAAQRPTMRFVAVKSEARQASSMIFKTRDLLVRQRTAQINSLRGHLAEFGLVAGKGITQVGKLEKMVNDQDEVLMPDEVRQFCRVLLDVIDDFDGRIAALNCEIRSRARQDELAKRLMTIPGIGPVTAIALSVLTPPAQTFKRGRDLAAWMGLTPKEHSTGGKTRLGRISKMGQRDLRRLLIIGATTVVQHASKPERLKQLIDQNTWLGRMIATKPRMLVATALANKMARQAWALMAHGGTYRAPAPAN